MGQYTIHELRSWARRKGMNLNEADPEFDLALEDQDSVDSE